MGEFPVQTRPLMRREPTRRPRTSPSPRNGGRRLGWPLYRIIVALDIEASTRRPNPVKGELRNKIYELFEAALSMSGIDSYHRDRFIDRGDGILALIHPVDQAPKALLLTRVVPLLSQLLAEYNAGLSAMEPAAAAAADPGRRACR